MINWFGHNYREYPFEVFNYVHLLMIAFFILVCILLFSKRDYFNNNVKRIRTIMFIVLFFLEALYHYWLFDGGYWDLSFALPLQVCSISLILCLILLSTNSQLVFQIVYFLGMAGAVQAILTPELFLGFPHFRFFQFFITHMMIVWTGLFYVAAMKFRPSLKGVLLSFAFLNISAGIAFLANRLTGGNYMFLSFKPSNASLIDYLGPYPFYIISLEIIALALFLLLYLPFFLKEKADLRRKSILH